MNKQFQNAEEFFETMEIPLQEKIIDFFDNLPPDFTNYFCELHELIKKHKFNGTNESNMSSSSSLKALLLHRFLLNPHLKILIDAELPKKQSYLNAVNIFKVIIEIDYIKEMKNKNKTCI